MISLRRTSITSLALFVLALWPLCANAIDLVEIVKIMKRSTVRIDVAIAQGSGQGSGVIVGADGLVLTNYHVVEGGRSAQISLQSGKKYKALGFVAVDPKHDLALLKTEPFTDPDVVAAVAEKLPETGERVAAFGTPVGLTFTATEGIVSATRTGKDIIDMLGRDFYRALGYAADATWIQTSTPISHGNSGGPLVNMNAEVVGLNTWFKPGGNNLNFAVGLPDIRRILEENKGKPTKDFFDLPWPRTVIITFVPGERRKLELPLPTGRVFSFDVFDVGQYSGDNLQGNVAYLKYPSGKLFAAAEQQGGILDGTTIATYENMKPMVAATYLQGKRHGVLKTFDEAGRAALFAQYVKGKRHGFLCLFDEGHLKMLVEYRNDQPAYIQLMAGSTPLEGFSSLAEAQKNEEAKTLFENLEEVESRLKTNEVAFRKQIASMEAAKRKMIATKMAPEKRKLAAERAHQQAKADAAAYQQMLRSALGK